MPPTELADGKYLAEVLSHYLATSSEKGTPSLKIQFHVLSNLAYPETPVDKQIYADLWLTENAVDNSIKTLYESLNWRGTQFEDLDHTGLLVGRECILVIENEKYGGTKEEYQGRMFPRVKFINSTTYKPVEVDPETKSKINALNDRIDNFRKAQSITETEKPEKQKPVPGPEKRKKASGKAVEKGDDPDGEGLPF